MMRHPPPIVVQVTEALAALFNLSGDTVIDRWTVLKRKLDASLLSRMAALDASAASRLPRSRVERFQRLIKDHPAFSDNKLQEKCAAVAPLHAYCLKAASLVQRLHGDTLAAAAAREAAEAAESAAAASRRDNDVRVSLSGDIFAVGAALDSLEHQHQHQHLKAHHLNASPNQPESAKSEAPKPKRHASAPHVKGPGAELALALEAARAEAGPAPQAARAEPVRVEAMEGGELMGESVLTAPQPPSPPARASPPTPPPQGARAAAALAPTLSANSSASPLDIGGLVVEPELWKLSEADLMKVNDLRVTRKGVGSVTFHGSTDCRGLMEQLKDLLVIEQGEVVVYPEPQWKPEVGQGLNKPASVTLYGCMPKSKDRLADPKARERYRLRVAHMTEQKGAVFEDYSCEDGTWKFKVHHF
jgi:hypothetical protein